MSRPAEPEWRPDIGRMAGRVAALLAAAGHPWPRLAAAILAERGRLGLDRRSFAARLGVADSVVAVVEDGRPSQPRDFRPDNRGQGPGLSDECVGPGLRSG